MQNHSHGGDGASLIRRKPMHDEAKFDITAMIDLVFMMNIYFLVTMVTAALEEINLPSARHCIPAERDSSVIISILDNLDGGAARVFVGEDDSGDSLRDLAEQEQAVRSAVQEAVAAKMTTVLIKAERNVRLRDVARVGRWAAASPGMELKLAVIEKE